MKTSMVSPDFYSSGQYYDQETGLHYNGARFYYINTGRYVTQDPIGFKGGDYNLYSYAGNNPAKGIDPTGLAFSSQSECRTKCGVRCYAKAAECAARVLYGPSICSAICVLTGNNMLCQAFCGGYFLGSVLSCIISDMECSKDCEDACSICIYRDPYLK